MNREMSIADVFTKVMTDMCEIFEFNKFIDSEKTRDDFYVWQEDVMDFLVRRASNGSGYGGTGVLQCGDTIYTISNGASKVVIVINDYDYVIKIPFKGYENLCEAEADIYWRAVARGFEENFAPCFYVCSYKELPLYAMIKCDCGEDYEDIMSRISHQYITDDMFDADEAWECYEDEGCLSIFEDRYEDEKRYKWCRFIHSNHISDIHGGNVGFLNGKLVMVDYSGF